MSAKQFIVVFDDGQGCGWPMTWDSSCDGALMGSICFDPVALFSSRADARKAIRISAAYARLCKEQGKPVNTDFTDAIKAVHIVELKAKP